MPGGSWEGVVVIVPPFTQRQHTENEVVPAVILFREWSLAPQVTNGVHAPRHVMDQEDPDQSAPQEPQNEPHVCSRQQTTEYGGYCHPEYDPQWEKRIGHAK
jgi:hypothetical protein